MTDPGQRPHLVEIQRATVTEGELGGRIETWHRHTTAWARISWGSGMERREAAQQNAQQTAVFEFDWSPTIAAVKTTDRAILFDTEFDIVGRAIIGQNREVHLTVIARLDEEYDS